MVFLPFLQASYTSEAQFNLETLRTEMQTLSTNGFGPIFENLVLVCNPETDTRGSGLLIEGNRVLTAAHCAEGTNLCVFKNGFKTYSTVKKKKGAFEIQSIDWDKTAQANPDHFSPVLAKKSFATFTPEQNQYLAVKKREDGFFALNLNPDEGIPPIRYMEAGGRTCRVEGRDCSILALSKSLTDSPIPLSMFSESLPNEPFTITAFGTVEGGIPNIDPTAIADLTLTPDNKWVSSSRISVGVMQKTHFDLAWNHILKSSFLSMGGVGLNDQTFITQSNLSHRLEGLTIGGMSGGPVVTINSNGIINVVGIVSQAAGKNFKLIFEHLKDFLAKNPAQKPFINRDEFRTLMTLSSQNLPVYDVHTAITRDMLNDDLV